MRTIASKQPDSTVYIPGNRGQKVSSTASELDEIIGVYEHFSELVQKLASNGLSAEAIAGHQEIQTVVHRLERYDEFSPLYHPPR